MPIQLLPQQDPITVKLSDGRVVPFGQGTICSDECPEISEDKSKSKIWIIPIASSIIICSVFCGRTPNTTTTTTDQPPTTVPEPITLLTLGLGLLLLALYLRRINAFNRN